MTDRITASEALYGFMGWLTSRQGTLTLGGSHDCAPAADVVNEFCDANDLAEPRSGWHRNFVHPQNKEDYPNES